MSYVINLQTLGRCDSQVSLRSKSIGPVKYYPDKILLVLITTSPLSDMVVLGVKWSCTSSLINCCFTSPVWPAASGQATQACRGSWCYICRYRRFSSQRRIFNTKYGIPFSQYTQPPILNNLWCWFNLFHCQTFCCKNFYEHFRVIVLTYCKYLFCEDLTTRTVQQNAATRIENCLKLCLKSEPTLMSFQGN